MEDEVTFLDVGVLVQMFDSFGVEEGTAALYAVDLIVYFQKVLSEVGAVLAGDSGY